MPYTTWQIEQNVRGGAKKNEVHTRNACAPLASRSLAQLHIGKYSKLCR